MNILDLIKAEHPNDVDELLSKAKYESRTKGADGKWRYRYKRKASDRRSSVGISAKVAHHRKQAKHHKKKSEFHHEESTYADERDDAGQKAHHEDRGTKHFMAKLGHQEAAGKKLNAGLKQWKESWHEAGWPRDPDLFSQLVADEESMKKSEDDMEALEKAGPHKYTKRYKGPDGKWVYVYTQDHGNYHVTQGTGIGGTEKYRAGEWAAHFVPKGEAAEQPMHTLDGDAEHSTNGYSVGHKSKGKALQVMSAHAQRHTAESSGMHGALSKPKGMAAAMATAESNARQPGKRGVLGGATSRMLASVKRGESKEKALEEFKYITVIRRSPELGALAEKVYTAAMSAAEGAIA